MRVQKLFVMGLLCGASLLYCKSAQADLIDYTQTFAGSTWNSGATDMSALTTSADAQQFQDATGTIAVEEWFGGNSSVTVETAGTGAVLFGGQQRARGAMVWIDLNGKDAGTYNLDVVLSTFNAGDGTMEAEAKVWELTGGDADGGAAVDLVATFGDPLTPVATGTGSAVTQLGSTVALTAIGTFSTEFTLSDAGVAGEFLGIQLRRSGVSGNGSGSYRADTVSISAVAVPEPSSLVLLGLAGLLPMVRRRR